MSIQIYDLYHDNTDSKIYAYVDNNLDTLAQ